MADLTVRQAITCTLKTRHCLLARPGPAVAPHMLPTHGLKITVYGKFVLSLKCLCWVRDGGWIDIMEQLAWNGLCGIVLKEYC